MNLPALLITVVTLAEVDWIPEEDLRIIATVAWAGMVYTLYNCLPLIESAGFQYKFGFKVIAEIGPFVMFFMN